MGEVIAERYEILDLIGRGGMGTVYKARQRTLDRIVAVKMLSEELASDIEFRARFKQEAAVLARLNHPAIVQIFDIESHGDTICIIMEYVEGETLQAMVNRLGALPEHRMLQFTAQVARGLAYAHRLGIIHRDVKPDNILISQTGAARIMDFGIAHVKGSSLKTQTGISMGTPRYMSPEQVTGRGVDGQADLYCLGLCLYFGLTGQPPFDGENPVEIATKQVYEVPPFPSAIFTAISSATDDAVMRTIAKAKEERWPDGDSMADSLDAIVRQRESYSRHSGIVNSTAAGMTGSTPVRVVLADQPEGPIPAGETQRVRQFENSWSESDQVGNTPNPDTANSISSSPSHSTPVPGLVPLSPIPASVADFEAPVRQGATPPQGTALTNESGPFSLGARSLLASPASPMAEAQSDDPDSVQSGSRGKLSGLRLIVLGFLVLVGLAAGYSMRFRGSDSPVKTPGALILPQDVDVARLEQETMVAITEGRLLESIKVWQEFVDNRERDRPNDPGAAIGLEYIRWLRSQIPPLQATDELVRRRLDRAQILLNAKFPAVAAAYTEKTVDLFGRSTSYDGRVEYLRRLIESSSVLPDPIRVGPLLSEASQIRNAVDNPHRGPLIQAEEQKVETLLLMAVQSDPNSFEAWMAAGRFYAQHMYFDDARVFFMTALDKAANGEERGTATQQLEALPGQ